MGGLLNFSEVRVSSQIDKSSASIKYWLNWLGIAFGCLVTSVTMSAPAAERVYVTYGILERSVSVSALEEYARNGTMDENIAVYAQYADPAELEQVRNVLKSRADLNPIALAQFLYSPQGEELLKRVGQVIQPESRESGQQFIRAAVLLASTDPEGLTVLNFLRKFPSKGLRVNVKQGLGIAATLEKLVNQTKRATTVIKQQSGEEQQADGAIAFGSLEDPRIPGPYFPQKQTITLVDTSRKSVANPPETAPAQTRPVPTVLDGRVIPVDIYLPERILPEPPGPAPVVVISHGLGSNRNTFTYLARHLASHGFAVLVPEHPGSNSKQLEALVRGIVSEVAEPAEFIDRPLDITYLLNEIERQAESDLTLKGRLNLEKVGVIGQSFGGYTALALGGAPINIKQLQSECQDLENTFNLSLLLQCRAGALPLGQFQTALQDNRIKAVIALNPITSAVLGQNGLGQIQVPTMIVTGNADTVAPALLEQIKPFTWLTTPDRYLVMMDGGTHFSVIGGFDAATSGVSLPVEVVGPNPAIARRYINALSLAFFKTYIAGEATYQPYLSAAYSNVLSEPFMPLSLVRRLTAEQLAQAEGGRSQALKAP
ncbi:MAG: alpha/beta hydrolase [Leptolyngbyaceae cyanobacterium HOT.MB2.61]|nr:alpha/beta hydrolase [Leptolyngbyaceae cyanobacterium HOT.MB2.61]